MFVTDIAKKLGMHETHVELIQYILCSVDLAEYGTSPRGCWLTDEGKEFLINFKKYSQLYWSEESPDNSTDIYDYVSHKMGFEFEPWEILGVPNGGYSSCVDAEIIAVMELIDTQE